ncbi:MAG: hypothetical protein FJ137_20715 [Deltaproteobacteria bacterium]|nr:hypothetical protein [Deltaproteobacteria bacterium]
MGPRRRGRRRSGGRRRSHLAHRDPARAARAVRVRAAGPARRRRGLRASVARGVVGIVARPHGVAACPLGGGSRSEVVVGAVVTVDHRARGRRPRGARSSAALTEAASRAGSTFLA